MLSVFSQAGQLRNNFHYFLLQPLLLVLRRTFSFIFNHARICRNDARFPRHASRFRSFVKFLLARLFHLPRPAINMTDITVAF